jgi:ABC-type dipeptide/oligopeptide/nickel transport system ATPase component
MKEILRYEHVDIAYDGKTMVQDMNISLKEGEIIGIVGESGSGKSTLLKAAMRILGTGGMVTKGAIWYGDVNLTEASEATIRKINGAEIAMVFQNAGSSFCPIRTVGDQLYEFMKEHQRITKKEFQSQAKELLYKLGFEDAEKILRSYPFALSGGMQQRIGVAAAMLLHPKVLLADEPTSALDVFVQKQVIEELLKAREMFGTSILLVTHNIGLVRAMADEVMVMKDGRMVEYGRCQDVLEHPKEAYTKKLMEAVPRLKR